MRFEYVTKCRFFYMEMVRDGAKSYLTRWNLIGGIQSKHMKNCLMSM